METVPQVLTVRFIPSGAWATRASGSQPWCYSTASITSVDLISTLCGPDVLVSISNLGGYDLEPAGIVEPLGE